ncbi:Crp/Fnr family transcriptional regulator [Variovorax terrae]|uniref:Crp/Fnr family transcriptional regulator n=1 Tax=Variovorax terrae TaxID=2923278 RepID=A0A9X1VSY1_9BURK|nr:Crp/Fnr family transcriptional regulator [Variovorax terrae]MCJ0762790.1 Crp/Fnr family transcriptional regulator [Variovorax terrae]
MAPDPAAPARHLEPAPPAQGPALLQHAAILSKARTLRVPAHTRIFDAGQTSEHIYIVQRGRVRTFATTAEGTELTTGLWSTGHVLGLIGAATAGPKVLSAESIDDATLLTLTSSNLKALVGEVPEFGWSVVRALAWMASTGVHRAIRLSTAPVSHRLIDALLMLAELPEAGDGRGGALIEGISQETIAGMVGATRPWVAQALSELSRRGLLAQGRMRIAVPDLSRLRAAARL